jgi:hypothetical protein
VQKKQMTCGKNKTMRKVMLLMICSFAQGLFSGKTEQVENIKGIVYMYVSGFNSTK